METADDQQLISDQILWGADVESETAEEGWPDVTSRIDRTEMFITYNTWPHKDSFISKHLEN